MLGRQGRIGEALEVLAHGDAGVHLSMVAITARPGRVQALEHFEHVDTWCLLGDLCARHARTQLRAVRYRIDLRLRPAPQSPANQATKSYNPRHRLRVRQ